MSNIGNYNQENAGTVSYARVGTTTQRIEKFAKYLHDFLPTLEEEFDDLERLQNSKPNDKFPIKMKALSDIYNAAKPLYEWYVEKAPKRQA